MDFDKPKVYGDTSITDGLVILSGPSLALVIVFASGQYNLDRQTLSERNNMEVKMFMRNVRNEIENHPMAVFS